MKNKFKVRSKVWLYPGMTGWHFVGVPKKESEQIKKTYSGFTKGWGSLPVLVTVGKTKWKTSIFHDKRSNTFLLPLKAKVRKAEGIYDDDTISFTIEIQT